MKTMLEMYEENSTAFENSKFSTSDGDSWTAPYLYKKVKELGLEPESVTLRHLDLSGFPWQDGSIRSMDIFLYHSVRIKNADYKIPIIMREDGGIMDGWHRIAKAILDGEETILAYRFESYIEPNETNEVVK